MATEPWAMTAPTNLPVAAQPPIPKTSTATNALPQRMCLLMLSSDRSQGKCILQPSLAHRTAAGWLTTFKGREAGLVCGVTAGLVCAVKQARFCSFGQNCCWIRNVCRNPTRFGSSYFRPPTTKQASNSSTDQGGGKRRAAVILTQIKVRTSRDFLLLNLSAALKCEATDEICPACAQRYRRNSLVPHTGQSSKLSVVRGVRRDSQWSDELRLCNLSAVSGHYQRNWRVLRPK